MSENLYKAPDAVVRDIGEYDAFGGWLRFFQFVQGFIVLSVVGTALYFVWLFMSLPDDDGASISELLSPEVLLDLALVMAQGVVALIVSALILRNLTKREAWVPKVIIRYLGVYFATGVVGFALGFYLYKQGMLAERPMSLFGDLVYYLIWSSYFKKSKRVNGYYRLHANGGSAR